MRRFRDETDLNLEEILTQGPVSYTHLDVYKRQVVGAALFTASNQLGGISLLPASGTGMVLGGNEEVVTLPVFSSEIKEEISSQPELSSEESVPPKPETSEQEKEESIQSSQPQESSEDSSQQASVEEEESQPETSKEEPSKTSEVSAPPVDPNGPEYQKKYPDMFVPQTEKKPFDPNDKVVYLTFDDGPSALTEQILDILDEYDVKATFFVVAKEDETSKQRLQMIAERGHTIGLHSYTPVSYTHLDVYKRQGTRNRKSRLMR